MNDPSLNLKTMVGTTSESMQKASDLAKDLFVGPVPPTVIVAIAVAFDDPRSIEKIRELSTQIAEALLTQNMLAVPSYNAVPVIEYQLGFCPECQGEGKP